MVCPNLSHSEWPPIDVAEWDYYLTIIKGISQPLNGPTNSRYDTEDSGHQGTMGEPLNCLDDASGTGTEERKDKGKWAKMERWNCYLGIPSSLKRPFTSVHCHREGGRGAHIYRLKARCQPPKKK